MSRGNELAQEIKVSTSMKTWVWLPTIQAHRLNICNPNHPVGRWEAEQRESLKAQGPTTLVNRRKPTRDPISNEEGWWGNSTWGCPLTPTCIPCYKLAHIITHHTHVNVSSYLHTDITHAYNWVYEFVRLQRIQISKRVLKLNLWSVCKSLSKMAKVRRLSQVKGTYSINTQHTQQEGCVARAQDSRTVVEPVWKVRGHWSTSESGWTLNLTDLNEPLELELCWQYSLKWTFPLSLTQRCCRFWPILPNN